MTTTTITAVPPRTGFFSMLKTLWTTMDAIVHKTGGTIITNLDSIEKLSLAANKHADHMYMTTCTELDSELANLKQSLESSPFKQPDSE